MKQSAEILEILKKQQERSERAREAHQAARQLSLETKMAAVERMLSDEDFDETTPVAPIVLKALYYSMYLDYTGDRFLFAKEYNARSRALWTRVEETRQAAGVEPEVFMTAQFVYFHEAFKTYPRLPQLTTEEAVKRAREYAGKVKRVVGAQPAPVNRADSFKQTEKLIQRTMRAQGIDRVEFYKRFILTGEMIVPEQFLRLDPAYKEAKG